MCCDCGWRWIRVEWYYLPLLGVREEWVPLHRLIVHHLRSKQREEEKRGERRKEGRGGGHRIRHLSTAHGTGRRHTSAYSRRVSAPDTCVPVVAYISLHRQKRHLRTRPPFKAAATPHTARGLAAKPQETAAKRAEEGATCQRVRIWEPSQRETQMVSTAIALPWRTIQGKRQHRKVKSQQKSANS